MTYDKFLQEQILQNPRSFNARTWCGHVGSRHNNVADEDLIREAYDNYVNAKTKGQKSWRSAASFQMSSKRFEAFGSYLWGKISADGGKASRALYAWWISKEKSQHAIVLKLNDSVQTTGYRYDEGEMREVPCEMSKMLMIFARENGKLVFKTAYPVRDEDVEIYRYYER